MKNIITLALMVLTLSIFAQNPCQDGTIFINGDAIDAVFVDNASNTGFSLPLWIDAGTTLAAGNRVKFISVIEFNEVNNAGNISLVYSKVLKVGTQTETVPAGRVWKVEAIVKHANAFASGFSASSNSPVCAGSQLNLTATSVAGATYSWTGPNGFTSSLQNPVINNITLAAAGTYSMTATLNGCTSTPVTTDAVINALPVSTYTYSPALAIANSNITFTPTQSGLNYVWNFDQGTPSTSTAENPVLQWSNAGNYDVTLTVTDNNGCTSSTLMVVTVSNCTPGQPASNFSWDLVSPQINQTVSFTPAVSGANYDWSFAGGSITSSIVENPDVIWTNSGTYNVSLTVTDANGCFTTSSNNIIITSPVTQTFSYTGSSQSFTVPAGVTNLFIEVWGAEGGTASTNGVGGFGGYAEGNLTVSPGTTIQINVGGRPTNATGGWNGGGNALTSGGSYGGAGGGGSDIRLSSNTNLNGRLIVAGGGGGGGYNNSQQGGNGGGTNGYSSANVLNPVTQESTGWGGTQSAGGAGGQGYAWSFPQCVANGSAGSFGQGGNGAYNNASGCGLYLSGGGGGGWYGGGAGATSGWSGSAPGAGGSGYIGGVSNGIMQDGVRTGHGEIKITY